MATRFVSVDRNTPMLLPPDLRDWIGEDDLVHFVIEAVDRVVSRNSISAKSAEAQSVASSAECLKSRININDSNFWTLRGVVTAFLAQHLQGAEGEVVDQVVKAGE